MRFSRLSYTVLGLLLLVCVNSHLHAQQRQIIVSPEVHPDRRVTFRLRAPNAKNVAVNLQGTHPMVKSDEGLWSATIGPFEPEIYEYDFVVDGLRIVDPSNAWLKVWLRSSRNVVEVPGEKPMFFEEQQVPHGTVHIHKYPSKSLGVTQGLYVYTPPGYETRREAKYPVLYLFHGFGDSEDAWTVVGRANLIVDNLLAKNKARPLIIVMPYGHTPAAPPVRGSIGNYQSFERDLIEDVIGYVQTNYRISTEQKDRAVAGLSMGGGQSLTIGLGNLELFGWLGAFSSAIPESKNSEKLLAEPESINDKLKLLWIGCGKKDFLFERNQKFLARLKTDKINHVAHITEGAHEWRLWRIYLSEFVPLLFRPDM
ncbi:alpha/beta hydrolase-fold protein [Planctomycetota bacterium]